MLKSEKSDLKRQLSKLQSNQSDLEEKYASQSKEINTLHTQIVKNSATQNDQGKEKQEELQRTIRELEGEVQILCLREKEYQAALQQRDDQLRILQTKAQKFDAFTQTTFVIQEETKWSPTQESSPAQQHFLTY